MSSSSLAWGSWKLGSLNFPIKFQAPPYLPNIVAVYETLTLNDTQKNMLQEFQSGWRNLQRHETIRESLVEDLSSLLDDIINDIGSQIVLQHSDIFNMLYNSLNLEKRDDLVNLSLEFFGRMLPGWIMAYRQVSRQFEPRYMASFERLLETNQSPKRDSSNGETKRYSISSFYAAHLLLVRVSHIIKDVRFLTLSMRLLYGLVPLIKTHIDTAVDYVCYTMSAVLRQNTGYADSGADQMALEKVKCNVIWESLGYYLTQLCEVINHLNSAHKTEHRVDESSALSGWSVDEATELVLHYGYLLTVLLLSGTDMSRVLNPLLTALDMLAWQTPSPYFRQLTLELFSNLKRDDQCADYVILLTRCFYLPPLWLRLDLVSALTDLLSDAVSGYEFAKFLVEQPQLLSVMTFELISLEANRPQANSDLYSESLKFFQLLLEKLSAAGLYVEKRAQLVDLGALWQLLPDPDNQLWLAPFSSASLAQIKTCGELRLLLLGLANPSSTTRQQALSCLHRHYETCSADSKFRPDAADLLVEESSTSAPMEAHEIGGLAESTLDECLALPMALWDMELAILPKLRNLSEKSFASVYALRIWQYMVAKSNDLLDVTCPAYLLALIDLFIKAIKACPREKSLALVLNNVDGWLCIVRIFLVTYNSRLSSRLQHLILWFLYANLPGSLLCYSSAANFGGRETFVVPAVLKQRKFKLPAPEHSVCWTWVQVGTIYESLETKLRFADESDPETIAQRSLLANTLWNTLYDYVRHDIPFESAVQTRFRLRVAHLDVASSHLMFLQHLDDLDKHTISVYDSATCLSPNTSSSFYSLCQKFLLTVPGSKEDVSVFLSLIRYFIIFADCTSLKLPSELVSLLLNCYRLLLFPQVLDSHHRVLLSFELDQQQHVEDSDVAELQLKGELVHESLKLLQLLTVFHLDAGRLLSFVKTTTLVRSVNSWLAFFVTFKLVNNEMPPILRDMAENILLIYGACWSSTAVLDAVSADDLKDSVVGVWKLYQFLLTLKANESYPASLHDLAVCLLSDASSSSSNPLVAAFNAAVPPPDQFYALAKSLGAVPHANYFLANCAKTGSEFIKKKYPSIVEDTVLCLIETVNSMEGNVDLATSLLYLLCELSRCPETDVLGALLNSNVFFTETLRLLLSVPVHNLKFYCTLFVLLLEIQEAYPTLFEKHVFMSSTVLHCILSVLIADGPAVCEQQQVARACGPFVLSQFSALEDGRFHLCRLLILRLLAFQQKISPSRKYFRDFIPCVLLLLERYHQRFEIEQESYQSMDDNGWSVLSTSFALLHDISLCVVPITDLEFAGSLTECLTLCLSKGEISDVSLRLDAIFHCVSSVLLHSPHVSGEDLQSENRLCTVQFLWRVLRYVPRNYFSGKYVETMLRGLLMCWMDWKDQCKWDALNVAAIAICALLEYDDSDVSRRCFLALKMHHYFLAECKRVKDHVVQDSKKAQDVVQVLCSILAIVRHFASSTTFIEAKAVCVQAGFLEFIKDVLLQPKGAAIPPSCHLECLRCLHNMSTNWDGVVHFIAETLRQRAASSAGARGENVFVASGELGKQGLLNSLHVDTNWSLVEAVIYQGIVVPLSQGVAVQSRDFYGSQLEKSSNGIIEPSLLLSTSVRLLSLFLTHLEIRRGVTKCGMLDILVECFARSVRSKEWKRCCTFLQLFLQLSNYKDGQVALCKGTPLLVNLIPCLKANYRCPSAAFLSLALLGQLARAKENRPYFFAMNDLQAEVLSLLKSKDLATVAAAVLLFRVLLYDFQKAKVVLKKGKYVNHLVDLKASIHDTYSHQLSPQSDNDSKDSFYARSIIDNTSCILQQLSS